MEPLKPEDQTPESEEQERKLSERFAVDPTKSPIDIMLDNVKWEPVYHTDANDDDIRIATHTGILDFGGFKFKVYQLDDGRRVIDAEDVEKFFEGGEE